MAQFIPPPRVLTPEQRSAIERYNANRARVLEGDYISGSTPQKARPVRGNVEGRIVEGGTLPPKNPRTRAEGLPPPRAQQGGAGGSKPPKGRGGRLGRLGKGIGGAWMAADVISSLPKAGTQGTKFMPAPFGYGGPTGQEVMPSPEEINRGAGEPVRSDVPPPYRRTSEPQSRTPQVPKEIEDEVKQKVEKGDVTEKEYVQAAQEKADLESMAKSGRPQTEQEREATAEKESSFWNQLGIDGKTAALIGVGLGAAAIGSGRSGFSGGFAQGYQMVGDQMAQMQRQDLAEREFEAQQAYRDEILGLKKAAAEAKGEESPESVATKQSLPQIKAQVVDVMEALELTPSGFLGMGGGNLPDEETYKRLQADFSDYIYARRQQGDTRSAQDLIMERYQQLQGNQ